MAVDWAATEAMSRGVGLRLVAAFLPPTGGTGFGFGAFFSPDALDDLLARADSALDVERRAIAERFPDLDVTADIVVSSPAAALVDASEEACLTVVGSRGMGGFRGLLIGSVGIQVATHAHSPTVVLRGIPEASATDVVVGVDGSPLSARALEFAFGIASRRGWRLIAVHAYEVASYDALMVPTAAPLEQPANAEADERRVVAEALAGFAERYPDVDVEPSTIKGPSVRSLVDAAQDAALLVVGSHGRGEFLGALLGSVSQGVLHRATVPVAVVGAPQ